MSRAPRTVLGLKPSELPRFGKVALAFVLTQITSLLGYLAGTTLFLKTCGARYLPWTFLAGYLVALAISAWFRKLRDTAPFTLLAAYFGVYAGFQVLSGLAGPEGGFWLRTAILTAIVPFPILCWMLFWNALQNRLLLREIKLWTPLISAAGTLFQVGTGLVTGPLGQRIGVHNLLCVSGVSLLASIVVLRWALATSEVVEPPAPETPGEAPAEDVTHPLVNRVGGVIFLGALMKYMVDLQLNAAAAETYGSVAEVAGFLGRFDSITKATIFVVQTTVTGWLLSRVPPGRLMSSMPILLGLASVAVLSGAGFYAILASHFLFTLYDKGTNRTCISLLLAPFPPERARQARLRLDGQVMGAGVITVSVAMIAFPQLLTPDWAFASLIVMCVTYRMCAVEIDAHYIAALRENLQRGSGEVRAEALGRLRAFSGRGRLEVLQEMLASPERDRRRAAAAELARLREPGVAELVRSALERETDPRVQSALVAGLPRLDPRAEVIAPLLASIDTRVRANAFEALAAYPGAVAVPLAEKHLEDAEPRPRASAAYALAVHALDRERMQRALGALRAMLEDPLAPRRAAACWALGKLGHPALVRTLCAKLSDGEVAVRRQAALALERIWSPAALPALQAAAADPSNAEFAPVLVRAIDRIEDRTRQEVLSTLGTLSREERLQLAVHLNDLGRDEVALLARALRLEDPAARVRVGQAIREARTPELRGLVERAIATGPAGDTEIRVTPLLEALRESEPGAPLWSVLERLALPQHAAELQAECRAALTRLAAQVAELPESAPLPAGQGERVARLVGLAVGDPSVGTTLYGALEARDPRSLSLSAELLEKVVKDTRLRQDLCAMVESAGDRAALKRAAAEVAARAAGE